MEPFNPIVTIPKSLIFTEPTFKHPSSEITGKDITTYELAKELEERFDILKIFIRMKKKEIKSIIINSIKSSWKSGRNQEIVNNKISDEVKFLFREYILKEEHGIKTKASQERGGKSFIDTTTYYRSMGVKVK